jgi:hypothetical protein
MHITQRKTLSVALCAILAALLSYAYPVQAGQPQAGAANTPTASISGRLTVTASGGAGSDLAGIAIKLTGPDAATSQLTVTDADGHYEFAHLAPGKYTIEVTQDGFAPWSGAVTVAAGQAVIQDAVLQIVSVNQKVEVRAEATEATTQSVAPTATVSDKQLDSLPLPTQKFTEALTLVPGVVRTAQGLLSFKGQAESQGMLLVDSAENVDPVSGSFSIPIPVEAIQSMTVYTLPESSGYGGFSGGLTTIETKPPAGPWDYKLMDFIPSFRGKNDHIVGLANWTPRFEFSGPLIRNRLNFSQEISYEFRRTPIRGLAWPLNETTTRATTSFTQFQYIWSPRHLLNVNINVFPLGIEFANINALVPQTASTTYHRSGVSVGASDTYQFLSGAMLNLVARYTRFDSDAYGQGPADMQISPLGWGGNFFNTSRRTADQVEALPTYQLAPKNWHGQHQIRFGEDVLYRTYSGSSISHPIDVLAQDGSLAEQINFQGAGLLSANDGEAAEFLEDRWTLDSHLTLNYGVRLSSQTVGRDAAFAPRAGFAYSPGSSGKTIIRGSIAEVYSHVPLLAADFTANQQRVLTFYSSCACTLAGQTVALQNTYLLSGSTGPQVPGTSPRTLSWNAEFERQMRRNLDLRVSYLDSHTNGLFLVDQVLDMTAGTGLLALRNTGVSQYRQAQTIVHYRPGERADFTVSYTWSQGTGDLNTLSDTLIPYGSPVLRPDVSGILPSEIPHRVLATGLFRLPKQFEFSPVVDVHTGLPYSSLDVLQDYAGVPDGLRFPTYFSMDIRVYREFPLHFPFMERSKSRKIRLGFYSTDVTNHHNPHDVYSNVTSPIFGQFAGFQKRVDGVVLDLVQ